MKLYIGTKTLLAEPMSRGEYVASRGWQMPADENPEDDGFRVKYKDGYISWSPREQFEEAYQELNAMSFGHALELLKEGSRVSRAGWNGKGMWLTLSPGGVVPAEKLWAQNNRNFAEEIGGSAVVLPYITMKTADDKIVPWLASQTDMLADDWGVVQ